MIFIATLFKQKYYICIDVFLILADVVSFSLISFCLCLSQCTCLSVSRKWLALGTSAGGLHLIQRDGWKQKLILTHKVHTTKSFHKFPFNTVGDWVVAQNCQRCWNTVVQRYQLDISVFALVLHDQRKTRTAIWLCVIIKFQKLRFN